MEYSISFNLTEGGFRIPVNPAAIDIREAGQSKTYDVAKLGEINVIKNPKLAEISFESEFPALRRPHVVGELRDPFEYIEQIEKWKKEKRPVHFVFAGSSFDINTLVSIEDFNWRETGGAVGDIEYSIKLKKYVPYGAKKLAVVQQAQGEQGGPVAVLSASTAGPRPDNREKPQTYTLAVGDTLWKVAQKFLGNGARYPEIQKLNNITDAQLKRLPVGMVLKLPA